MSTGGWWPKSQPERRGVKNIVVCCDGTWCGESKGTTTNVKILADSFAGRRLTHDHISFNEATSTLVGYFDGAGLAENVSFVSYLLNGAMAFDIKSLCVEAYRFIVENYEENAKVWLFGLSRGAFTVRTVAAMVNNCGILKRVHGQTSPDIEQACKVVYDIYSNPDPAYKPNSAVSSAFKSAKSHQTKEPPIRFMGLFDTVGALGLPTIKAESSYKYAFYDQVVSREVETVCQALALHDRLANFEQCFVRRSKIIACPNAQCPSHGCNNPDCPSRGRENQTYPEFNPDRYKTQEVWFPGSHYDIGRQRFLFFRSNEGTNPITQACHFIGTYLRTGKWGIGPLEQFGHYTQTYINLLGSHVTYTTKLSDPPLLWIMKQVQEADVGILGEPNLRTYITNYARDTLPPLFGFIPIARPIAFKPVTIDAYDRISKYCIVKVLSCPPQLGSALRMLLEHQLLGDRHIPLYNIEYINKRPEPEQQCFPKFFCPEEYQDLAPEDKVIRVYVQWPDGSGREYTSKALEKYRRMDMRPVAFEYVADTNWLN